MNTLIPIDIYTLVYYHVLLIFVIVVFAQSSIALESGRNLAVKNRIGIFVLVFLILYIGTRPVNFRFGDMMLYAVDFDNFSKGEATAKDPLFDLFTLITSQFLSVNMYFLACAFLYVFPLYLFSRKVFQEYWFYAFFMLAISFSFWTYGVNGIRNGIATSLFLLAVSREKKVFMLLLMGAAIMTHKSLLLPAAGYLACTYVNNNTRLYFMFWALCIPLSLALGSALETFFLTTGVVEEEKLMGYLGNDPDLLDMPDIVKTGFRWDFILYSATGVFAGWYYIFKRGLEDVFYQRLFNTFLFANGIWILVIRANFSNRFAYLSWFMLGVIIIYPLLKNQVLKRQHFMIGLITFVYFAFTYVLNVVLSNS